MKKTISVFTLAIIAAAIVLWQRPSSVLEANECTPKPAAAVRSSVAEGGVKGANGAQTFSAGNCAVAHSVDESAFIKGAADVAYLPIRQVFPDISTPVADWRAVLGRKVRIVLPICGEQAFSGEVLSADATRTTYHGNGVVRGDMLSASAMKDFMDVVVTLMESDEYEIHVSNQGVRVLRSPAGPVSCGNGLKAAAAQLLSANQQAGQDSVREEVAAADAVYYCDVLAFYLPDLQVSLGSNQTEVDNTLTAMFVTMNAYLANSQINNFRWRLAGSVAVSQAYSSARPVYVNSTTGTTYVDLNDDLQALSATSRDIGQLAATKKDELGGDTILFFIDRGAASATNNGGLAWLGAPNCVVERSQGTRTNAHELAHNSGAQHDRETARATDNDGISAYGHKWSGQDLVFPSLTQTYGDLMAYGGAKAPLFANPNVLYGAFRMGAGVPTVEIIGIEGDDYFNTTADANGPRSLYQFKGGAWTYYGQYASTLTPFELVGNPTGLPKTDPKAAFCAQTIMDNAASISGLKPVPAFPVITSQPQNVSVYTGEALALSISVTGDGGMAYAWYKNGQAVSGATASSFRKTAADSDAGSYYVICTNSKGSVTSATATVTVSQKAAPAPQAGGGGGGACSGEFLIALGILATAKSIFARRKAS